MYREVGARVVIDMTSVVEISPGHETHRAYFLSVLLSQEAGVFISLTLARCKVDTSYSSCKMLPNLQFSVSLPCLWSLLESGFQLFYCSWREAVISVFWAVK